MKHVLVLRDASTGALKTGATIRLHPGTDTASWSDGQGNSGAGTDASQLYTDNNDGSYYKTITVSGEYSITVDGSAQDELTGIYIVADDNLVDSLLSTDFVKSSGKWEIAADIIDKTNVNPGSGGTGQGLAGDGLSQNSDGTIKAYVDATTIEIDATSKKIKVISGIYAASGHNHDSTYIVKSVDAVDFEVDAGELKLLNKSFSGTYFIDPSQSIHENLVALDIAIRQFAVNQGILNTTLLTFSAVDGGSNYNDYMIQGDYTGEVIMPFAGTIKKLILRKVGGTNETASMSVSFSEGDTIGVHLINNGQESIVNIYKNGVNTNSGLAKDGGTAGTYLASIAIEIS